MARKNTTAGYSPETLAKVVTMLKGKTAEYIARGNADTIRMAISSGNRKIGRVMNVSLPPIVTCANCAGCRHYCYDVKACLQYSNTVVDARARNLAILKLDRDAYFSRIDAAMKRRRRNKFFRWHVAGEIIDVDYFDRMVENARRHPDFIIWTYTKNYNIVNAWIAAHGGTRDSLPENFHVMFSEWRGMEMVNPYGMPEFRVVFPGENPTGHYCPGNCDVCKGTGRGCVTGETTYCRLH